MDQPGWGVVKALLLGLRGPLEHGGADGLDLVLHVLADDDDGHACGADVLLRARVDDGELGNVDLLAEYGRAHVRDERDARGVGDIGIMRTEYGVVEADMHVVRVLTEIGGLDFGYVGVRSCPRWTPRNKRR